MKSKFEFFISPGWKRFEAEIRNMDELPTIVEEDKNFALEICKEYPELIFDDVCLLTRFLRFNLTLDDYKALTELLSSTKELFDPKLEIKKIILDTNRGEINIKASHYLFKYFHAPIKRIRKKIDADMIFLSKALNKKGAIDGTFGVVVDFFYNTTLGNWQRKVAIGMTSLYFELFAREPILTEEKWNQKPTGAISYKHYLAENVEPRVQTYLNEDRYYPKESEE